MAARVSVAMGTYNGAAFLAEQLESIAAQDRPPDELVVCDDASTDATAAMVRAFAARAPFEVRLEINAENVGSTSNFAKAVGLCRGEIIFLADQDDVWMPHKVRLLSDVLAGEPGIGFVASDARLVDPQRRPLGCTLWEALPFPAAEQAEFNAGRAFDVLLRRNVVTGTTMAFRAGHRDLVLPIPAGWVHDAWIALLISAVARGAVVAEPLVDYRQHAAQQIGARRESLLDKYRKRKRQGRGVYEATAQGYEHALERLRALGDRVADPAVLEALERKVDHWRARGRMRTQRTWRLPLLAREILHGSYVRYSSGWKSVAEDILL